MCSLISSQKTNTPLCQLDETPKALAIPLVLEGTDTVWIAKYLISIPNICRGERHNQDPTEEKARESQLQRPGADEPEEAALMQHHLPASQMIVRLSEQLACDLAALCYWLYCTVVSYCVKKSIIISFPGVCTDNAAVHTMPHLTFLLPQ